MRPLRYFVVFFLWTTVWSLSSSGSDSSHMITIHSESSLTPEQRMAPDALLGGSGAKQLVNFYIVPRQAFLASEWYTVVNFIDAKSELNCHWTWLLDPKIIWGPVGLSSRFDSSLMIEIHPWMWKPPSSCSIGIPSNFKDLRLGGWAPLSSNLFSAYCLTSNDFFNLRIPKMWLVCFGYSALTFFIWGWRRLSSSLENLRFFTFWIFTWWTNPPFCLSLKVMNILLLKRRKIFVKQIFKQII